MKKVIVAEWDCIDDKSDKYTLLSMIHAMAGQDACKGDSQWHLHSTATYSDYAMTVWSNDIVNVVAETYKDEAGNPTLHVYRMENVKAES